MRRIVSSGRLWSLVAGLLCVAATAGCVGPGPLPPALPAPRVVDAVDERAGRFYTLKDTDIGMRIQTPGGRSPGIGGILVYDRLLPGLWLRGEKLTRPVFSLKALGTRFWLAIPHTREVITGGPVAYARIPFLLRPGEIERMLAGPDGLGLTWPDTEMDVDGDFYRFEVPVLGGRYAQILVDRRDLVVRVIRRYDPAGRLTAQMHLDDYKEVDGRPFPRTLTVLRLDGRIRMRLKLGNPELNTPLPPEIFKPRSRPGWRVIDLDSQPLSDAKAFTGE